MGADIYISLERELDTEIDGETVRSGIFPRSGKAIAANMEVLEAISTRLDLPSIDDLYSQAEEELDDLVPPELVRGTQWFEPGVGLKSIEAWKQEVGKHPEQFQDPEHLQLELEEARLVLQAAMDAGVKFYFGVAI